MTTSPSSNTARTSTISAHHNTPDGRRNSRTAWIVLVIGLMITAAATLYMKASVEKIAEQEFISQYTEIQNKISSRLSAHARILQSGAALFNASEIVTREQWRVFTQYLKVNKQLPGLQGIGFNLLIPRSELTKHIQEIHREGFPDYTVKPDGEREIYSPVTYLEPFSGRNLLAFGYDTFSDPVRRAAMEQARDTDSAALSDKIFLVQETGTEVQPGALMYVPVYRKDMPTDSVEHRRAAIFGWVSGPYRMTDLMQGILGARDLEKEKQLHLHIFDGEQPSPQSLLYACHPVEQQKLLPNVRFTRQIPLNFNGHHWTLHFTQTGGEFFTTEYIRVWLTLGGGLAITLLLFALILTLLDTRAEAQRMVDKQTAELRQSEKRYRDFFENANDLIHALDTEGHILYVNKLWRETLGYSEEEARKLKIFDIVDARCKEKCESVFNCLMKGQKCEPTEAIFIAKDGQKFFVEGRCNPKLEDGKPIELLGIFRDVTERKLLGDEREKLITDLKEALSKVQALEGILPICASCKMIRDDNGGWNQIEAYIRDRSSAQFSHGICPDCAKKLYPNIYPKITQE